MQVLTHTNQLCYGALWQKKAYKHLPNRYFIWNNTDSSIKVGYSWTIYKIIIPNTPKDILIGMVSSNYLNEILENCKDYCKSAGPMINKVFNVALKDALDDGYLETNPLLDMKKYYWDVPAMVIYSKKQIQTLLQAAYEYHSVYLEILLALFVGLRKGEILGLKYSEFFKN